MPVLFPLVMVAAPSALPQSVSELAPYLKMLSTQAGSPGRVACRDADMASALKREGVSLDAQSRVAWAQTPAQVQAFAQEGKFVIVGSLPLLAEGASLALVREGGRLVLVLNFKNAHAAGVPLSDALLKLVRPL